MLNKVIIFGGSSGIGLQTAILLSESFEVYATGRDQKKMMALKEQYPKIQFRAVDSTDEKQLAFFAKEVGNIHHVVMAMGGSAAAGPIKELSMSDLSAGFENKLFGHLRSLKATLPHLAKNGSATFVSAVSAQMANPGTVGLAAINGAIEAMVRPLAVELAPLRINAVSPGVVDTPWWNFLPPEQKEAAFNQYANAGLVGRVGDAKDIALGIRYLIENTFTTGVVLTCDGGLRLKAGG
jgi:NAD(P)-dependent dehydrogenase (short-subunit alcohol dehydrogenase family)